MALDNYIEDDWGDNFLRGRNNLEKDIFYKYSNGGNGKLLKGVYRPKWKNKYGGSSAANNQMEISDSSNNGRQTVLTPSIISFGLMKFDFSWTSSNGGFTTFFIAEDISSDWIGNVTKSGGDSLRLSKYQGSSRTDLISGADTNDGSWYTVENIRDSYGNLEMKVNGTSNGTANDSFLPNPRFLGFDSGKAYYGSNRPNSSVKVDNLVVR